MVCAHAHSAQRAEPHSIAESQPSGAAAQSSQIYRITHRICIASRMASSTHHIAYRIAYIYIAYGIPYHILYRIPCRIPYLSAYRSAHRSAHRITYRSAYRSTYASHITYRIVPLSYCTISAGWWVDQLFCVCKLSWHLHLELTLSFLLFAQVLAHVLCACTFVYVRSRRMLLGNASVSYLLFVCILYCRL